MKTLILYYTFGGSTQKEAERLAKEKSASLCRVKERRDRKLFGAFIPGGFQAITRKAVRIQPIDTKLDEFDRIIIGCSVWAGYPAPVFNSMVKLLPKGKEVELVLCSAGGETPKSEVGTRALIEKAGCKLVSYRDVRTGANPSKLKE